MTRDDNYSPFMRRHPLTPKLDLIEMVWRVVGPSNRPLVCGIFETAAGPEVRRYYQDVIDDLQRSERAADIDIARDIAAAWKQAIIEKGFEEIRLNG